jgi:hypothetical protein
MYDYNHHPQLRRSPEQEPADERNLFEMYRDAIFASQSGQPVFTPQEIIRVEMLEAIEAAAEHVVFMAKSGELVVRLIQDDVA